MYTLDRAGQIYMITKYITCLLYAICAKPEKKDDYTTTNHTGVNGPTGPQRAFCRRRKRFRKAEPTHNFWRLQSPHKLDKLQLLGL